MTIFAVKYSEITFNEKGKEKKVSHNMLLSADTWDLANAAAVNFVAALDGFGEVLEVKKTNFERHLRVASNGDDDSSDDDDDDDGDDEAEANDEAMA